MEFEIKDFENVKVNIKDFLDFVMPSNKPSMRELANILYPDIEDFNSNYFYVILNHIEDCYQTVNITKKNGKKREINIPWKWLADIQKRIYKYILCDASVSECAAAYAKGRSIHDATVKHIGQPILVKLDIKSFFESIDFETVKDVFLSLGFDKYQTLTLANFCCYKGRLPQGTSTSPMISNLVMREFDDHLSNYCLKQDIKYTRYSDDMLFSGDFDAKHLIGYVNLLLQDFGFELNRSKTKVIKQGQRQSALGVVLNEKQQVSKEYRRKIRQEIYYCSKHSVKSHILKMNDKRFLLTNGNPDYIGYIENLYGRINFALQVNPRDAEMLSYRESIRNLFDTMKLIKALEQKSVFEWIYKYLKEYLSNPSLTEDGLYDYLVDKGFLKRVLRESNLFDEKNRFKINCFYDDVLLTRDDINYTLSLIFLANGEIRKVLINKYGDGFFGSKFDKSLGYLIITSDKITAATAGITNLVSFNGAPNKFYLSIRKLCDIEKYGNKVIIADCPGADHIRAQMIANHIEVI